MQHEALQTWRNKPSRHPAEDPLNFQSMSFSSASSTIILYIHRASSRWPFLLVSKKKTSTHASVSSPLTDRDCCNSTNSLIHNHFGLDSKDYRYRTFSLRNSPLHCRLCIWKIRFKNQVTICSDFPSGAMLWIKDVEMVDSLEELKSSRSVSGKNFPNFEMLDAKIASALNKIIQNSHLLHQTVKQSRLPKSVQHADECFIDEACHSAARYPQ